MSELYDRGIKVRREVLGDEYVDNALKNADEFSSPFQELVTEVAWGSSWGREGLTRKQRSLNILCLLAGLGRSHELEIHLRGALRNGCSREEIRETLIQAAVYAGMPAGVEAFGVARRVLAEQK